MLITCRFRAQRESVSLDHDLAFNFAKFGYDTESTALFLLSQPLGGETRLMKYLYKIYIQFKFTKTFINVKYYVINRLLSVYITYHKNVKNKYIPIHQKYEQKSR